MEEEEPEPESEEEEEFMVPRSAVLSSADSGGFITAM